MHSISMQATERPGEVATSGATRRISSLLPGRAARRPGASGGRRFVGDRGGPFLEPIYAGAQLHKLRGHRFEAPADINSRFGFGAVAGLARRTLAGTPPGLLLSVA